MAAGDHGLPAVAALTGWPGSTCVQYLRAGRLKDMWACKELRDDALERYLSRIGFAAGLGLRAAKANAPMPGLRALCSAPMPAENCATLP